MDGRKAHARADHVDDLAQIGVRGAVVDARRQRRLVDAHVAHGVHEQIGQLVGGIEALAGEAAHAHVDEGLIAREEL